MSSNCIVDEWKKEEPRQQQQQQQQQNNRPTKNTAFFGR